VKLSVIAAIVLDLVVIADMQTNGFAQPPAGSTVPQAAGRGFGGRGMEDSLVVSPKVGIDRSITFRYSAPNAKEVSVSGELDGKSYPMKKD
jgi:hypothetical protein